MQTQTKDITTGNGSGNGNGNGAAPAATRKRKQARRKAMWAVIAALIVAGAVFAFTRRSSDADTAGAGVQTAQAFRTTIVENVSATGSVTAQTGAKVNIGSQVSGRIKALYTDVGRHINANQVIAVLDSPDVQSQLNQAQASLNQAETKLQQQQTTVGQSQAQTNAAVGTAQAALEAAQAKYQGAVSASAQAPQQTGSDISKAQAALRTAQATLNQVQKSYNLQIATAQAAIRQAQANQKNTAALLSRDRQLLTKGYIAASEVDAAEAQAGVNDATVSSAQQNLALTRAKADADVQTAKQQVAQARAGVTSAGAERFTDAQRQQDVLNAAAAVSQAQAQLTNSRAGLTSNTLRVQDVTQAREAVRAAQDQVSYWQAQLAKTVIRSPISGTVLSLAAQQGETVAAGLNTATLVTVTDLSRLQVDAYVDETDIGKVKDGMSATVTVDAYPNRTFQGRVFKVASGATIQQNVVTYDVSIAVKDPDRLLKPDMTASVNVAVGQHPNVVAVPSEAVKQAKSGSYVWVGDPAKKQTPQMQPVQTGATDGTYTEITAGVEDGDTVVLAGWPPSGGAGGPGGGVRMTPFGPSAGGGGGGGRRGGG